VAFGADVKMKAASAFYPEELVGRARANAKDHAWARQIQQRIARSAEPWLKMSDERLWSMMFGNTIKRSWMVWSNGHCPACGKGVPMYNWKIDAVRRPWKVTCPHCKEVFPKNDFLKFYRSGLDEHGVFDPKKADRTLLFNAEHPAPKAPKHRWGVDDGEGFRQGRKRWRFIGAYLIYGQWKQLIVGGLKRLSAAYVVTGDRRYAHKAGILLDRVADLYPTFDFQREGVLYEGRGSRGYVSTWHDACNEVREIALAYDRVFEGLRGDEELVAFLAGKAKEFKLANRKATFADIQQNIEDRIFRDTIRNREKIRSNKPRTEVALLVIHAVLGWPANRESVLRQLDRIIVDHTRVDGMTGEKGLAMYSTIGPRTLAALVERFAAVDATVLPGLLRRRPQLRKTWRFHVDTHCLGEYYPQSGDTGAFAMKSPRYRGVDLGKQGIAPSVRSPLLPPSGWSFLWRLYKRTGDADYARILYRANGGRVDGLPHDIFAANPGAMQTELKKLIASEGTEIRPGSVNKPAWHIALLRSGSGKNRRASWLDYDSGGGHGHADGMNLGLFAKGLDLMPDFGYPPVQFGGWKGKATRWYQSSAAHNTVVVDRRSLRNAAGRLTLWADGQRFRAIRASAPAMTGGKQYERTVAVVDVSDRDFYVLDIFRVVGGRDHAKFVHSHFGDVTTGGLNLKPAKKYGDGTRMSSFRTDPQPDPGWSVDWTVRDHYGYLPQGAEVHLRYTDLTAGASASVCKAWVVAGSYDSSDEQWIRRVMIRRRGTAAPLASTFVAVIEPYGTKRTVASIRRLPLVNAKDEPFGDADVAVEVTLRDGRKDLLISADVENPLGRTPSRSKGHVLFQRDRAVRLDGQACFVRFDKAGRVERLSLCKGKGLSVGGTALALKQTTGYVELARRDGKLVVVSGDPNAVQEITER
jgi:hypothetical protein